MRIFPLSDLHLERRRLDLIAPPAEPFDLLACPGDLYEGHPERGLAALLHLAQGRPVVLVPGNHERYAPTGDPRTAPELLATLEAEVARLNGEGGRIHLLQKAQACVIDGVRFVGTTLWSDWGLAGRWLAPDAPDRPDDPVAYAAARMTDPVTGSREYLGSIRKGDGRPWQPADAMAEHWAERAGLHAALHRPHDGRRARRHMDVRCGCTQLVRQVTPATCESWGFLLPTRMRVILAVVQQSQLLHLRRH